MLITQANTRNVNCWMRYLTVNLFCYSNEVQMWVELTKSTQYNRIQNFAELTIRSEQRQKISLFIAANESGY